MSEQEYMPALGDMSQYLYRLANQYYIACVGRAINDRALREHKDQSRPLWKEDITMFRRLSAFSKKHEYTLRVIVQEHIAPEVLDVIKEAAQNEQYNPLRVRMDIMRVYREHRLIDTALQITAAQEEGRHMKMIDGTLFYFGNDPDGVKLREAKKATAKRRAKEQKEEGL